MPKLSEIEVLKRGGGYARGRGKSQRAIIRAFAMMRRSPLSTSELRAWSHAHLELLGHPVRHWHRGNAYRACRAVAVAVGRSTKGKGRPVLWSLRPEYDVDLLRG